MMGAVSALSTVGTRVLLVGTGRHSGALPLPDVPAVEQTVRDLGQAFVSQSGLNPDNLQMLLDSPSPVDVALALADASDQAQDVLFFYYVGHGLVSPDGELHLATSITDRNYKRLGPTALPYATVRRCLLDSRARSLIVILDCCFSGRAVGVLGATEEDPLELTQVSGGFVLAAASREEMALAPRGSGTRPSPASFCGF